MIRIILTDEQCARLKAGLPEGSEAYNLVVRAEDEGTRIDGLINMPNQVAFPMDRVTALRFLSAVEAVDRGAANEVLLAIREARER